MNKPTRVLVTIGASAAIGAVLGILYGTEEGARTRRRIVNGCNKLMCLGGNCHTEERDSLDEVKEMLQKEIKIINDKIEKLS